MLFPGSFYVMFGQASAMFGKIWANDGLMPRMCPKACFGVVKSGAMGVAWANNALIPKVCPKENQGVCNNENHVDFCHKKTYHD